MFQLTESCVGFQPELGGCYGVLHDWITAEVQRLRECGLKILVFLDGKKRRLKARTTEERRRKREDQWLKFYDFCEEGVALSANDLLPLPALCMAQLKASLKACGVQYVQCDEEADQEIAKYVCASNADLVEERFFAYGRDSDYLLMRDCPYIEMGPAAVSQLAGTSGKKRRPNKNKKDAEQEQVNLFSSFLQNFPVPFSQCLHT
ncbi:hypothetical protein B484DRAFT_403981 [Ochromonadaceae sp. CCMP2298]|nr:hypothetical protein B484DRAFT_403981 [Ochromonadaceae sp. CCMP2298]